MIFNETFMENTTAPNPLLHIRQAGILHCDPQYTITRSGSETGVVGFVVSGQMVLEWEGNHFHIRQGESFVLPSNLRYVLSAQPSDPPVMYWLNMRGSLFAALCGVLFQGEPTISHYQALDTITALFQQIKDRCQEEAIIKSLTTLLLDLKFGAISKISTPDLGKADLPRQMEAYISNHLQDGFSVTEMAKAFFMSTDSVNRIFQQRFQVTPYGYYQNLRIHIAKSMLQNTTLSIEDIAQRLHFTDRNYFSLYFKAKTGQTPVQFRKSRKPSA